MMRRGSGEIGGFTIIEVVLVLAIAGLIFLMAFITFPILQRSQRDSQRQRMVTNVSAKIMDYQNNNNGKLPNEDSIDAVDGSAVSDISAWPCSKTDPKPAACFIRNYLNNVNATENEFQDPDGWYYGLTIETLEDAEFLLGNDDYKDHMVYVLKRAKCDGEKAVRSNNSRDYAVVYKLEGSGTFCKASS